MLFGLAYFSIRLAPLPTLTRFTRVVLVAKRLTLNAIGFTTSSATKIHINFNFATKMQQNLKNLLRVK